MSKGKIWTVKSYIKVRTVRFIVHNYFLIETEKKLFRFHFWSTLILSRGRKMLHHFNDLRPQGLPDLSHILGDRMKTNRKLIVSSILVFILFLLVAIDVIYYEREKNKTNLRWAKDGLWTLSYEQNERINKSSVYIIFLL